MHLIFIRHAQSYVNLPDWNGENYDEPLTPLGHEQAQKAAAWVKQHLKVDAMYTSTMQRTLETARYITEATGMDPLPDDRLREFGNCWQDGSPVPLDVFTPKFADFWATADPFEPVFAGGESWVDFINRVGGFVQALTKAYGQTNKRLLLVAHGGVINAMNDIANNGGPRRTAQVWIRNTGISHWEYILYDDRPEMWRLHAFNMAFHLGEDTELLNPA